ncbi:hypothetical protein [Rhodococcus sp. C3V]|uniref:hypothetical protein n=1 Tax=Rhodococcus sp. C3V TaxID=3034165 RepID=UPI0023E32D22|nr:hypothetical protein [Rhodococcus sp. C3V]MDF3319906.1 hypothetical protein [Rhodococcus sp. C3V]
MIALLGWLDTVELGVNFVRREFRDAVETEGADPTLETQNPLDFRLTPLEAAATGQVVARFVRHRRQLLTNTVCCEERAVVRSDNHIPINRAETRLFESAVETVEPTRFRIAVTYSVQKKQTSQPSPSRGSNPDIDHHNYCYSLRKNSTKLSATENLEGLLCS